MATIEVYRKDATGRMVSEGTIDLSSSQPVSAPVIKKHGLRLLGRPGRGMRNNFYGASHRISRPR